MKVSEHLKIQDEIQHRLIAALFSHKIAPRLVFHGGTMLRVCGVPDYRFSEDLDMLLEGLSKKDFYSGRARSGDFLTGSPSGDGENNRGKVSQFAGNVSPSAHSPVNVLGD